MAKTDRVVAPSAGSQTYPLMAQADDMAGEPLIARMLISGRNGGITGAAMGGLSEIYRRGQGINSSVADAVAPALFATRPEQISETVQKLRQRQIADAIAAKLMEDRARRAIQGVIAGGSVTAN